MKLPIAVVILAWVTAASAAQPPPPPARSAVGAGYVFKPDPQDYYPSISRELKEEGLTTINFCYDVQGRPVQVTVARPSGYARLDEAAVRLGKAVRVRPAMIDGEPQPACILIPVRFSLDSRPNPSPKQPPEQGEQLQLPPVDVPPILKDIPPPPPPPMHIPLAPSRAPGSIRT
jgi:TonB family protein